MENIPHNIICDLRWGGFNGTDIDEIMSDSNVVLNHGLRCEVSHDSCAEGPDSYRIYVVIGVLLTLITKPFLEELGKDLYRWCKSRLSNVFKRKNNGEGLTELRFEDVTIEINDHPSEDSFADCWLELPELITSQDLSKSKVWRLEHGTDDSYKLVPRNELKH